MIDIIPKDITQPKIIDTILTILLVGLIIVTSMFVLYEIRKKNSNDRVMKYNLESFESNIKNYTDPSGKSYNLRDFYIMSSYNSCCNGDFRNGYVTLDALKSVISKGARVLDLEIYNMDNQPIVACSTSDSYDFKDCYNSLQLEKVIRTIRDNAFSASTCPNFEDPLILHLRVKTKNVKVCNKIASIIAKKLTNIKGLGGRYNYGYSSKEGVDSLMEEPITNFLGKVIIMTDNTNEDISGSDLIEITNIFSNTFQCQKLRDYDVMYTPNADDLINKNKENVTISMPDLNKSSSDNMKVITHMGLGCQMICMNFQNMDNNLLFYLKKFNEAESAFILKPEELRYIPIIATIPINQDPGLSYAERTVERSYFSHKI